MWLSPSQTYRSTTSQTQDIIWDIWLAMKGLEACYLSLNPKVQHKVELQDKRL